MGRGRKRDLPDLKPKVFSVSSEEGQESFSVSTKDLEGLAKKHGYPPSLVDQIYDICVWYAADQATLRKGANATHQDFLTEMGWRAYDLWDALNKAGPTERSAIHDALRRMDRPKGIGFDELARQVRTLALASDLAVGTKTNARPGRRTEADVKFLCGLHALNTSEFGVDAPRITKAGDYQGKFFDFANDLFLLLGVKKSNSSLGQAIVKAIKIAESRSDQGQS